MRFEGEGGMRFPVSVKGVLLEGGSSVPVGHAGDQRSARLFKVG
jgi:hypothetical protein